MPENLSIALSLAEEAGLLMGDVASINRDKIAKHRNLGGFSYALEEIQKMSLTERELLFGESDMQACFNIIINHRNPQSLTSALILAQKNRLLIGDATEANRKAIMNFKQPWPYAIAESLIRATDEGLLTGEAAQANRDIIANHQQSGEACTILIIAQNAGLLTGEVAQTNRDAIAKLGYQPVQQIADALACAQGILSGPAAQKNFISIVNHQNPHDLRQALGDWYKSIYLKGSGAQANFNAIVQHEHPRWVSEALERVYYRCPSLLQGEEAQANFDAIVHHAEPPDLANSLMDLNDMGWLQFKEDLVYYRTLFVNHREPSKVVASLVIAKNSALLAGEAAQVNRDAIAQHQNISGLEAALALIRRARLLDQHRFSQLILYSTILFTPDDQDNIWSRIPAHTLTPEIWDNLMRICRANQVNVDAGRVHIWRYIQQQLLGAEAQGFNAVQSTHTASIHQTVSESARRLKELYKDEIHDKIPEILSLIKEWILAQPNQDAAKRAITYFVESPYDFEDSTSKVTMKELLALCWTAIHDENQRLGTLEDAQALFLEGLYDIQRAYNLSDDFKDMGGDDKTACASGAFNKLIEKLVGVHPAITQRYITHQGAVRKLIPLILETAKTYMDSSVFTGDDVSSLKESILSQVREQLYFEYGGAQFERLTAPYETFDVFKRSEDYGLFQSILEKNNTVDLELMLEGMLLVPQKEVDEKLTTLLEAAINKKEPVKKVLSKEEVRNARLKFFEHKFASDPDVKPNEPSSRK